MDSENSENAENEKNEDVEATVELLKACRAGVQADFLAAALNFLEEHQELWESAKTAEIALDALVGLAEDLEREWESGDYKNANG